MEIDVTANFLKCLRKNRQLMSLFEDGANKALNNPALIRTKEGLDGIYSLDLRGGNRALLAKDATGNLVPFFVGNHDDYMQVLKGKPSPAVVLTNLERSNFKGIDGSLNHIGHALGRAGGSETKKFIEEIATKLGKRGGAIAGLLIGAAVYMESGDAKAALETMVPGASSTIALMDDRDMEALMCGIEEFPLGFAGTEFLRPLIRAARDDKSVDPGMIEEAAKAVYDHYKLSSRAPVPVLDGMQGP